MAFGSAICWSADGSRKHLRTDPNNQPLWHRPNDLHMTCTDLAVYETFRKVFWVFHSELKKYVQESFISIHFRQIYIKLTQFTSQVPTQTNCSAAMPYCGPSGSTEICRWANVPPGDEVEVEFDMPEGCKARESRLVLM